jgi:hypothetical protein
MEIVEDFTTTTKPKTPILNWPKQSYKAIQKHSMNIGGREKTFK